jgi:mRNA interferase MazF
MEKGDIVIIRNKNQTFTSKTRSAIIYQNGLLGANVNSLAIVLLTSSIVSNAEPFRINILPDKQNGLTVLSQAMPDKITTILKSDVGEVIGKLDYLSIQKIDEAVKLWLSLF